VQLAGSGRPARENRAEEEEEEEEEEEDVGPRQLPLSTPKTRPGPQHTHTQLDVALDSHNNTTHSEEGGGWAGWVSVS